MTAAVVAGMLCLIAWTGTAAGVQPYETYEGKVAADGPVAQFRFGDAPGSSTIVDSAGSYTADNHGIVLGGEGPFAGSSSGSFGGEVFASLPEDPLAGANEFTAEAWVNWAGGTSYKQPVFDFGAGSNRYMYLTPASSLARRKMLFEIRTSATTDVQLTAPKLAAHGWEYVAVTETNSGTLTLYVNGAQVGETTGSTLSPASLGSATEDYLGRSLVPGEPDFHGSLSNVVFYGKALPAAEILAHYYAAEYAVNTSPPTITGTTTQGRTLSERAGGWSGLTPITFAYQWERCNTIGEECASIASATESQYTLANEDVGRTLRVTLSGSDVAGASTATSPQSATIRGVKPFNTVLPAISGQAEAGQLLTVANGTWEGTTPITYAYKWERCNGSGLSCKRITGAHGSSYRPESSQVGGTLRVVVTASNLTDSTKATTQTTPVVTAGPPVDTVLPAIFGKTEAGQTLSASIGVWAGSEPFAYTYQWQSCNSAGEACANIAGATSSTYALTSSSIGTSLRIVVTANNAVGSESATSSASAVVKAVPPLNTALPAITGTAREAQTLTASAGSWTAAEPISYGYQWQRCGRGVIGSQGSLNGQFEHPAAVAADASGELWVLDRGNDRVEEFNERGEYLRQFGSAGSGEGQVSEPSSLAVDRDGDVWVADTGNSRVEEFSPSGQYILQLGAEEGEEEGSEGGRLQDPEGVAIDRNGDVWVSEASEGRLVVFARNGEYLKTVGSPGSAPGQLGEPEGIAIDAQGHVWVADWSNARVEEFSEQGEYLGEFGTEGTGAGQIELPYAVAVDSKGDVLVGDVGNDRVEEFSEQGAYLQEFGTEGSETGQFEFAFPIGLAVLASGDVWLTDAENDRLEGFSLAGEYLGSDCTNIAGATGRAYTPTAGDMGVTLQVVVTASDASGQASATSPLTAAVVPEPPADTASPTIEGVTEEGDTLTAAPGTWSSNGPVAFGYQWQSCNSAGESCANIAGAEGSTYVAGQGDVGKTLRVLINAENAGGTTAAPSSPTSVVAPASPVNVQPPAVGGVAKDGETLTASTGAWSGTPPLTYTYQWQSCNALGEGCIYIPGATGAIYLLGAPAIGTTLEVVVTASNAVGSTSATSSPSVLVAVNPPESIAAPTISGTAAEGEALSASPGSWTGAEPISFSYQWQRCSVGAIGSEGSGNGQFDDPADVALDAAGDLWVVDHGGDRVQEFSDKGEYLRQLGSEGSGDGQLREPSAVAIGSNGDVWVADTGNNRVEEFSAQGEYIRQLNSLGAGGGQLNGPEGVTIDAHGDVWVSDTFGASVGEFDEQGEYLRTVGTGELAEPEGMAIDSQGHVWVADWLNDQIDEFAENGEFVQAIGSKGTGDGQLDRPDGIAVSPSGDIWVTDIGNDRVEEFTAGGEYLSQFGPSGAGAGQFGLTVPAGLAVLAGGDIWLTDAQHNRLVKLSAGGDYLGGRCTGIAGATSSTYSPTAADTGSALQVIVTAANADGEANATSLPTTDVTQG